MRRVGFVVAVAAVLLLPAAALGQVSLGARAGYAFGFGKVGGTLATGDWVSGQVPLQVDVLYRVDAKLAVGAYYSYGFGRAGGDLSSACDAPGADCSASVQRLGAQLAYALAPRGRLLPWLGVDLGYEWSKLEDANPAEPFDVTFKGWEFLGLQGGADWSLGARLVAGPFLAVSFARYGEGELPGSSAGSTSLPDKAFHEWVTLGLRGRLDL